MKDISAIAKVLANVDLPALEALVELVKRAKANQTEEAPAAAPAAPAPAKKPRKTKAGETVIEAAVGDTIQIDFVPEATIVIKPTAEAPAPEAPAAVEAEVTQEVVDQAFALALSPPLTPIPPTFQEVTDFWPRIKNMPTPPDELRELCKKIMTATLALDKEEGAEMVKGSLVVVGAKRLSEVPDWLLTRFISALTFGNIDLRHCIARGELDDRDE